MIRVSHREVSKRQFPENLFLVKTGKKNSSIRDVKKLKYLLNCFIVVSGLLNTKIIFSISLSFYLFFIVTEIMIFLPLLFIYFLSCSIKSE